MIKVTVTRFFHTEFEGEKVDAAVSATASGPEALVGGMAQNLLGAAWHRAQNLPNSVEMTDEEAVAYEEEQRRFEAEEGLGTGDDVVGDGLEGARVVSEEELLAELTNSHDPDLTADEVKTLMSGGVVE